MVELLLPLFCGVAVGLSLGLTGGGGSLFALPLLVYVLDIPLAQAVPASLLVVGITALLGSIDALRLRLVFIRPTLLFAALGILTAPAGLWLGAMLADQWRLALFAILAAIMGFRMWRQSAVGSVRARLTGGEDGTVICPYEPDGQLRFSARCAAILAAGGALTGLLSGIFGVGGGFLIVPILMATIQLPITRAIASSLVIITVISASGAISAYEILSSHIAMLLPFASGGLLGMLLGRMLAARLPEPILQKIFSSGLLLVAIGLIVSLVQEGVT